MSTRPPDPAPPSPSVTSGSDSGVKPPPRWRRPLACLVTLAVVGGQIALGVRMLRADDARYGWGMFGQRVDYAVLYYWETADGRLSRFRTGDEVPSAALKIADGDFHQTRYGIGTVRTWINGYLRYMWEQSDPAKRSRNAVACIAELSYDINRSNKVVTERLRYPPADVADADRARVAAP